MYFEFPLEPSIVTPTISTLGNPLKTVVNTLEAKKTMLIYQDINRFCILFTVQNSVFKRQHFQNNTRDGKRLKNLKQRLNLLYPKSSSLWIKNNEKFYITKLTISLN